MAIVVCTFTDTDDGVTIFANYSRDVLKVESFTKAEQLAMGALGGLPNRELARVRRLINGVPADDDTPEGVESADTLSTQGVRDGGAAVHE